jgi:co-chaperonin GroES (HSP10)
VGHYDERTFGQAQMMIESAKNIRLLGDRILIKPLDWDASKIIVAIRDGRPVRGEVVACGPGRFETRRNKDRTKLYQTKTWVPMELRPGDIVELGGLNIFDGKGYQFTEILVGTEKHIVCQQADVCCVREPDVESV